MILKLLVSGLVLAGGFFAVNTPAPQDEKAGKMPSPVEMAKLMEAMKAAATPGEPHKHLTSLVGKWDLKTTMTMPGFPKSETTGSAEYKSILGGRFVIEETTGSMKMPGPDGKLQEMPFSGFQLLGYDNVLKQYQSVWCDSMGTGIFMSTGTADASGNVITYEGAIKDVLTPEGRPFKMAVTVEGADKHTVVMWDTIGTKLEQVMSITATRAK